MAERQFGVNINLLGNSVLQTVIGPNTSTPTPLVTGQLWFDLNNLVYKSWNGTNWTTMSSDLAVVNWANISGGTNNNQTLVIGGTGSLSALDSATINANLFHGSSIIPYRYGGLGLNDFYAGSGGIFYAKPGGTSVGVNGDLLRFIYSSGFLGVGSGGWLTSPPNAYLTISSGTTLVAPLRIIPGVKLTSISLPNNVGSLAFDGTYIEYINFGGAYKRIAVSGDNINIFTSGLLVSNGGTNRSWYPTGSIPIASGGQLAPMYGQGLVFMNSGTYPTLISVGSSGNFLISNGSGYVPADLPAIPSTGNAWAPSGSAYVTIGNDANLASERALTAGTGISIIDFGANGNVYVGINSAVALKTNLPTGLIGFGNIDVNSSSSGQALLFNGTGWVHAYPTGISSLNGQTGPTQLFSSSDVSIISIANVHTLAISTANTNTRGLLSSGDWNTFNNKLNGLIAGSGITIVSNSGINVAQNIPRLTNFASGISISGTILLQGSGGNVITLDGGQVTNSPTFKYPDSPTGFISVDSSYVYSFKISPVNNLNSAGGKIIRINATANGDKLTGIASGWAGREIYLRNVGNYDIVLQANTGSVAANQFSLPNNWPWVVMRPADTYHLIYDDILAKWRIINGYRDWIDDPLYCHTIKDDFFGGNTSSPTIGELNWTKSGNGTVVKSSIDQDIYGQIALSVSNVAGQDVNVNLGGSTAAGYRGVDLQVDFTTKIITPNGTGNAVDDIYYLFGIGDYTNPGGTLSGLGAGASNVVGFEFDRAAGTGWRIVTSSFDNAGTTFANTSVGVTTSTWKKFRFLWDTIAGQCQFWIDDRLEGTISSNLPDNIADSWRPFFYLLRKTATAGTKTYRTDYARLDIRRSTRPISTSGTGV